MPFGLRNAPTTFQCLVGAVLCGLVWSVCFVYLDDIIVLGNTFQDHCRVVFARLANTNVKFITKKCSLFQKQVHYLEHTIPWMV